MRREGMGRAGRGGMMGLNHAQQHAGYNDSTMPMTMMHSVAKKAIHHPKACQILATHLLMHVVAQLTQHCNVQQVLPRRVQQRRAARAAPPDRK